MNVDLTRRRSQSVAMYGTARFLILVRVLLLAVGLGIVTLGLEKAPTGPHEMARPFMAWLLLVSAVLSVIVAASVRWFDRVWKLFMPLLADVMWIGLFCYASGGVDSQAVPMLFALCLTSLLVVPGSLPFLMPSLASLVLAGSAVAYLADFTIFSESYLSDHPHLRDPSLILGSLIIQIAGLFTVDALGQILTKRLREQRVLTDEVLDQLGEGVIVLARDGRIAYANNEVMRLLGLPENVVGVHADEVFAQEHLRPLAALARCESIPMLERYTGPDLRSLVVRVTGLTDRRLHIIGRVLLVADETRLMVLEDSARRAERLAALGEMAAGIAHEVRNPLTSLRGCAQEIAEICQQQANSDGADLARVMIDEADRLARIVDDVLTLSRLRAGERSNCSPNDIVDDLQLLLKHEGNMAPIQFDIEDGCPNFTADADQLRQVLLNLIANSRDAIRDVPEPQITVRISEDETDVLDMPAVCIAVTDNGCGIPEHHIERIFTPFYTTKARGTGLGLMLVQRIVKEHEGVMRITSAVGKGTVVMTILPSHSQTRTFRRALGAT